MGILKNTADQRWRVFAFNRQTNEPVAGDAANITAKIRKDWGTATATNDTNPTEVEGGYYDFNLTQAETNANWLDIFPESSTSGVQVIGVPGSMATVEDSAGAGAVTFTPTIRTTGGTPIANCEVWITTDSDGANVIAGTLITDAFGKCTFYLDEGTYSMWLQHPNYTFPNPQSITVAA